MVVKMPKKIINKSTKRVFILDDDSPSETAAYYIFVDNFGNNYRVLIVKDDLKGFEIYE